MISGMFLPMRAGSSTIIGGELDGCEEQFVG